MAAPDVDERSAVAQDPAEGLGPVLSQPSQGGRNLAYLAKLQNHSILHSSSGGVTYKKSDQANNDLLFDQRDHWPEQSGRDDRKFDISKKLRTYARSGVYST